MKAIILTYNVLNDLSTIQDAYENELASKIYFKDKLESNSYKSDNSREIEEVNNEIKDLKRAIEILVKAIA